MSIEEQSVQDYDVLIVDDASTDPRQAKVIQSWCDSRDERWQYVIQNERQFAPRNQFWGINILNPKDDDVIVWLDLDGDRFAHSNVLAHLIDAYADDTLLTYGSYRPIPDMGTSTMATPFPDDVVLLNTYRKETLRACHFNHLRTMKGELFRSIPAAQFKWPGGGWYEGGTDYVFMVAGLERAGGRYKYLPEVLCLYNHANPLADNIVHPQEASACVINFLSRPPLSPL